MEYEPEWEKRSHCRIGYWISKTILGLKWQQENEPEIDEMLHCLTDKLVESVTFKLNDELQLSRKLAVSENWKALSLQL